MKRVLIVGATGVLGSAAAMHFLQHNFSVRAFVRNKEKAAALEKEGAEIFTGDLTNHSSIVKACDDVDVILACAHGMLGKGKNKSANIDDIGHKTLVDSTAKAGVEHFIYSSVFGASKNSPIDFNRSKFAVEEYIEQSGLNYTILRFPAFMEWHVHNLLGKLIIEKGKVTILGKGDNPTNFVAVNDIVQALDKIILNKDYYNRVIKIAGPQNMSRNEIAKLYGSVLNITPRIRHVPVGALKILSSIISPFHEGIGRIMKFAAYYDNVDATMNPQDSILQVGLQPTTIEAFIRKQVNVGRPC